MYKRRKLSGLKNLRSYYYYNSLKTLLKPTKAFPLSDENIEPFFIIGSGRSGNTLLRSILTQNKNVVIPPESYVLGKVIHKYYHYIHMNNITWNELCALILANFENHPEFKWWGIDDIWRVYKRLVNLEKKNQSLAFIIQEIYKEYAKLNNLQMKKWGDKTPLNSFSLTEILKVFPNAKFVHLIRDGRDVVASYKTAKLYENVEEACDRWVDSLRHIRKFSSLLSNDFYHEVKYETLVNSPLDETKKICKFLNIGFQTEMIYRSSNIRMGDVEGLNHHKNVKNPISTSSIGKWETSLTAKEKNIVLEKCNYYLKAYYYI
ncbi:sulfotransferase family protein [Gracilibacillus suaedae]|uniref:sulfotransferase family protein n=1 Tax=Gracilibacillus suaedae TaxID=2820273 RepID=UPI001ABE052A|nr:sulfotransferase [Gracilibacillus suaedae]